MTRFHAAILFLIACVVGAAVALGAPPPGGPGPHADWYRSLQTPRGGSCCDESDCREADGVRSVWIEDDDGNGEWFYDVLITPKSHGAAVAAWVRVPPDRILARENPTGKPVACWLPDRGVMCFVRPSEI